MRERERERERESEFFKAMSDPQPILSVESAGAEKVYGKIGSKGKTAPKPLNDKIKKLAFVTDTKRNRSRFICKTNHSKKRKVVVC